LFSVYFWRLSNLASMGLSLASDML
jgi:hypothetical protein